MQLAQQKKISWLEIQQIFSTEEACRQHLFQIRWRDGFKCPACGNSHAYEHSRSHFFEYTKYSYQVSVTVGSIMH